MSGAGLVSVIVPGLNEQDSIEELFSRVQAVFRELGRPFEFIFVDDGSSDDSLGVIQGLMARRDNVGCVSHFRNHGKSFALMQGFDLAEGEVAVLMDADLQDQPEDIPLLLDTLETQGLDLVNGWRAERKDTPQKRFVSRIYNWIVRRLFKVDIHDVNCGFKALRKIVYKRLDLRGDLHRLIPVLAAGWGFKVGEAPVRHQDRKYGKSRYKLLRFKGILDIFTIMAANTSQLRPFHVFTEVSAAFWGLFLLLFLAWLGLGSQDAGLGRLVSSVLAVGFGWSLFMATVLPLFGFLLEVMTSLVQDRSWRQRYTKATLPPRERPEAPPAAQTATPS